MHSNARLPRFHSTLNPPNPIHHLAATCITSSPNPCMSMPLIPKDKYRLQDRHSANGLSWQTPNINGMDAMLSLTTSLSLDTGYGDLEIMLTQLKDRGVVAWLEGVLYCRVLVQNTLCKYVYWLKRKVIVCVVIGHHPLSLWYRVDWTIAQRINPYHTHGGVLIHLKQKRYLSHLAVSIQPHAIPHTNQSNTLA